MLLLLIPFFCSCQESTFKCNPNIQHIYTEYDYNSLEKDWIKKDLEFAKKIKEVLESNSKENILNAIPINKTHKKFKLINEHVSINESYGKGYFGIFYDYVLKNDSLISYKLSINRKKILYIKKYGIDLRDLFFYDKEENAYIYLYNVDEVSKPYKEIKGFESTNDKIKFYMSPFSGTRYGCRGGYGNIIIDNRCAFKQIENDLTTEDIFYILHSINPASRLTAVEYYYKNTDRFNEKEQEDIEIIIENIYEELGDEIEVLSGDIVLYGNPRDAVKRQLEKECW